MKSTKPDRGKTFKDNCESIFAYWNFLASDQVAQRFEAHVQGQRIRQLIRLKNDAFQKLKRNHLGIASLIIDFPNRMHQMIVIDPKWIDEVPEELHLRRKNALVAAEHMAKKWKVVGEYVALKQCHPNAWPPPILMEILSGKPTRLCTGKLKRPQTFY